MPLALSEPFKLVSVLATHHAPSVVYPVGHSRFNGYLLFGLWLAGSLSTMLWLWVSPAMDWRLFLAVTAMALAGLAAYIGWKNSPVGQLAWDGQFWRWEGPGYQAGAAEQKLSVVVDLQNLLLLRLENPAHAHLWLWAQRKVLPERWLDLRRAVYSPHKAVRQARQDDLQALGLVHAVAVSGDELPTDSLPKP